MRLFVVHPLQRGGPKPMERLKPLFHTLVPGLPPILSHRNDAKLYQVAETEWITDDYVRRKEEYHHTEAYGIRYEEMRSLAINFRPHAFFFDFRDREGHDTVPLIMLTLMSHVARSFPLHPMVSLVTRDSLSAHAVQQVLTGIDTPPRVFTAFSKEMHSYLSSRHR